METFKKRHGKKIASVCFVIMWIMALYPFIYWMPRPELTFMQVAHEFWYFVPTWVALLIICYIFDNSNDIYV